MPPPPAGPSPESRALGYGLVAGGAASVALMTSMFAWHGVLRAEVQDAPHATTADLMQAVDHVNLSLWLGVSAGLLGGSLLLAAIKPLASPADATVTAGSLRVWCTATGLAGAWR